jgi:methanogenic corrinoid protein MtbC1
LVDYLCWAAGILESRNIPERYLTESLDWLGEFFAERMAHSDGAFVATTLLAARTAFTAADHAQHTPPKSPLPWPEAAAFEAALLGGNQSEALAVVNRCIEAGNTLVAIELHVIQPALYRIGEQWQSNRVTVAQEHLATAIAQSVMTVAFMRSSPVAPIGKQVLLACVEGNNHALGLRMVADAFHFGGWDTQYLGANMPTSAIVQQVEQCKPDLVALSVAFPQQLQTVKRLMQALDERFGNARPAVIVGGLAINRFNTIANSLGADVLGADAEDAVVAANRIIVSDHIS